MPEIREWVNERLREAAAGGSVVMEGRDIGTVVLPDAEVKVFLEARLHVRAERRQRDLESSGYASSLDEVEQGLRTRDERDSTRREAPLTAAPDAIYIDGSDLDFDDQVSRVIAAVESIEGSSR
jgi:cytidylate kinase